MTLIKRSKFSRARGNKTHGWGHKKKHRGSGNRGGKGNAGTGKRADSKKPSIWKNKNYLGKHGFTSVSIKQNKVINIITLITLDKKFKEGAINLTELGYDKLLATGKVSKKFEVTVKMATPKAIEKIEAAGGKVLGLKESAEEKQVEEESTGSVEE